jgi:hypothetical protein
MPSFTAKNLANPRFVFCFLLPQFKFVPSTLKSAVDEAKQYACAVLIKKNVFSQVPYINIGTYVMH